MTKDSKGVEKRVRDEIHEVWVHANNSDTGLVKLHHSVLLEWYEKTEALENSHMASIGEDVIDSIIAAYRKYQAPEGVDAENKHPEFWIQCIKTGLAEVESDLSPDNIKKEFADLAFIAIDGLFKMGYDPRKVLSDRLEQNSKKDLSKRTKAFYVDKETTLSSKSLESKEKG